MSMMYHNLLPEEHREVVRYERLARFFFAFWICIALILLVIAILLLPSYFFLTFESEGLKQQITAAEQGTVSKRVREAEATITSLNQQLAILAAHTPSSAVTHIDSIARKVPPGVNLSRISFQEEDAEFRIAGTAARREDLLAFLTALRGNKEFSSADAPIENLLKERNIDFEATVALLKN